MHNKISRWLVCSIAAPFVGAVTFWSTVVIGADTPGARPGDENLSCVQIATELQPYMQKMMPSITAMGQATQEVQQRSKERMGEAATISAEETAEARASTMDPTGMASKIVGQQQAQRQKERWQQAEKQDKPIHDKYKSQVEQVAKEAQSMQSDTRLQRLMQLAQEKHCQ
jgi:hypothetical protein